MNISTTEKVMRVITAMCVWMMAWGILSLIGCGGEIAIKSTPTEQAVVEEAQVDARPWEHIVLDMYRVETKDAMRVLVGEANDKIRNGNIEGSDN